MSQNLNPIQTGLFWHSLDWGVGRQMPPSFLKNYKSIDMKLTSLIKHHEINL